MNNPLKKQTFASKIVVFNGLDYSPRSFGFVLGFVFTVFMALSGPTVAQAFTPSMTLLHTSGISAFSSAL
ncbi:MAG: hypothetical protein II267_05715, partial [Paludibacteraceae bacterium]|nr:hypothetical protein [Paludibacteraceae bacterium]